MEWKFQWNFTSLKLWSHCKKKEIMKEFTVYKAKEKMSCTKYKWQKKTCAETNMSYDRRQANSLHISHVVSYFYETEFEIWVGFGPTDRQNWKFLQSILLKYPSFEGVFFFRYAWTKKMFALKSNLLGRNWLKPHSIGGRTNRYS